MLLLNCIEKYKYKQKYHNTKNNYETIEKLSVQLEELVKIFKNKYIKDKENSDYESEKNEENSDKENSDKENSDKENSDEENSDKENSDKENSDKENSDKENSDKENSDNVNKYIDKCMENNKQKYNIETNGKKYIIENMCDDVNTLDTFYDNDNLNKITNIDKDFSISKSPEFVEMQSWIMQLNKLKQYIKEYSRIPDNQCLYSKYLSKWMKIQHHNYIKKTNIMKNTNIYQMWYEFINEFVNEFKFYLQNKNENINCEPLIEPLIEPLFMENRINKVNKINIHQIDDINCIFNNNKAFDINFFDNIR
jgi:hypothetical protein